MLRGTKGDRTVRQDARYDARLWLGEMRLVLVVLRVIVGLKGDILWCWGVICGYAGTKV